MRECKFENNDSDDNLIEDDNRGRDHTGAEEELNKRISQKNKTRLELEKIDLQELRDNVQDKHHDASAKMDHLIYLTEKFNSLNKITQGFEHSKNDALANEKSIKKLIKKSNEPKLLVDLDEEQGDQEQRLLNDIDAKDLIKDHLENLNKDAKENLEQHKQMFFGQNSSENMLYENFNYLIAIVTLDLDVSVLKTNHDEEKAQENANELYGTSSQRKEYAPKTIEILVKNHNVGSILEKAKVFWKQDSDKFVLQNDKRITLSNEELVWDIFYYTNQKLHKIQFYLCHKYKYFNKIIKLQKDCIHTSNLRPAGDKKNVSYDDKQDLENTLKVKRNQTLSVKENYKIFFDIFPKMEEYIDKDKCTKDEDDTMDANSVDKKIAKERLNSIFPRGLRYDGPIVFCSYVQILILLFIELFVYYDPQERFLWRQNINMMFNIEKSPINFGNDPTIQYFHDITTQQQFYAWLGSVSGQIFINSNPAQSNSFFWGKTIWLSPVTVVTYRVNSYTNPSDCPISDSSDDCYEINYSGSNIETQLRVRGTNAVTYPYSYHNTTADNDITSYMIGYYSKYGGNGYVWPMGIQSTQFDTTVNAEIETIIANANQGFFNYIDKKTIAIAFMHQGYILDIDKYFVVNLQLERNSSWNLTDIEDFYEVFVPYLSWNSTLSKAADTFSVIQTIQIVVIYVLNINFKMSKFRITNSHQENITPEMHWKSIRGFIVSEKFMQVFVVVFLELTYQVLNLMAVIENNGTNYLTADEKKYTDMRPVANGFKSLIQIRSLELGFVMMRMFFLLMNSIAERDVLEYLIDTLKLNLKWMLLMFPMYFVLSAMGRLCLGAFVEDFGKQHTSFINVVLTSLGRMTVGESLKHRHSLVIMYYSFQYIIGVFFTFNMYLAFGQKTYYEGCKQEGYFKPVLKQFKDSTFKRMMKWFQFFVDEDVFSNAFQSNNKDDGNKNKDNIDNIGVSDKQRDHIKSHNHFRRLCFIFRKAKTNQKKVHTADKVKLD